MKKAAFILLSTTLLLGEGAWLSSYAELFSLKKIEKTITHTATQVSHDITHTTNQVENTATDVAHDVSKTFPAAAADFAHAISLWVKKTGRMVMDLLRP